MPARGYPRIGRQLTEGFGGNPSANCQLNIILTMFTDLNYRYSFETDDLIFVPTWKSIPASWKAPNECLWNAPSDFITKVPLKEIYVSSFQGLDFELDHIAGFFRGTLDIDDIDWVDVIDELKELKLQPTIRGEGARQLYGILFEKSPILESHKRKMR
jgi:hypothetical protein